MVAWVFYNVWSGPTKMVALVSITFGQELPKWWLGFSRMFGQDLPKWRLELIRGSSAHMIETLL